MRNAHVVAWSVVAGLAVTGALVVPDTRLTAPLAPTLAAAQGQGGGGRTGGPPRNPNEGADFTPQPPIPPKSPSDQAQDLLPAARLPDGARRGRAGRHPSRRHRVRRQRPDVCRRVRELHARRRRQRRARSRSAGSRRFESTKGDGHYDKRTVFADKLILPRMILPLEDGVILTQRNRFRRRGAAHRHEWRRRRRQEGGGLQRCRRRPRRQPRAPAERLRLGTRQLDLQHLQRLSVPLDAGRFPPRADRTATARSGAWRRMTTARSGSRAAAASAAVPELPVPDSLRRATRWAEQTEPGFDTV